MGVIDVMSSILSGGMSDVVKTIAPGNSDVVNSFATLGLSDLSGDLNMTSIGKSGFEWTDKKMGTEKNGINGGGLNAQIGQFLDIVIPAYFGAAYGVPAAKAALAGSEIATAAETSEAGLTASDVATATGETAPESISFVGKASEAGDATFKAVSDSPETSFIDRLLNSKNVVPSVIKAGSAVSKMGESPTQVVYGGSSSTRVTQPSQDQDINKLMGNALGPDQSSIMFSNKGITLKNSDQNALTSSFLGGNFTTLTPSKAKGDLAFRTLKTGPSPKKDSIGLNNVSLASPFYQA